MNREEALISLKSPSPQARREAARVLAECAESFDLAALQEAFRNENTWYVKSNIRRAMLRLTADVAKHSTHATRSGDFGEATQTIARLVVHEVRQYLNRLILQVQRLRTKGIGVDAIADEIERLNKFLDSLLSLADVSSPPLMETFELSAEIEGQTREQTIDTAISVLLAGANPAMVVGDKRRVDLIYRNALRNAIEATEKAAHEEPIIVNWGDSDVDYWLSVADSGCGLAGDFSRIFDVGKTTKRNHLGMGLSIALQAAESIGGSINLTPRDVGCLFELRWPKSRSD